MKPYIDYKHPIWEFGRTRNVVVDLAGAGATLILDKPPYVENRPTILMPGLYPQLYGMVIVVCRAISPMMYGEGSADEYRVLTEGARNPEPKAGSSSPSG